MINNSVFLEENRVNLSSSSWVTGHPSISNLYTRDNIRSSSWVTGHPSITNLYTWDNIRFLWAWVFIWWMLTGESLKYSKSNDSKWSGTTTDVKWRSYRYWWNRFIESNAARLSIVFEKQVQLVFHYHWAFCEITQLPPHKQKHPLIKSSPIWIKVNQYGRWCQ